MIAKTIKIKLPEDSTREKKSIELNEPQEIPEFDNCCAKKLVNFICNF
jgi:hypothetical protein